MKRLREVRKNQKNVQSEIFGEQVVSEKGKTEVSEERFRQERLKLLTHFMYVEGSYHAREQKEEDSEDFGVAPHY